MDIQLVAQNISNDVVSDITQELTRINSVVRDNTLSAPEYAALPREEALKNAFMAGVVAARNMISGSVNKHVLIQSQMVDSQEVMRHPIVRLLMRMKLITL